jgi:hypothetical protein
VADGYTAEEAAYNKAYYERNKQLKGRQAGKGDDSSSGARPVGQAPPKDRQAARAAAAAKVKSLNAKLTQLRAALQAARAKSKSYPNAGKSKAESDAAKKKDNEEYYNKNKQKIANDRKAEARKSGGSSSGGSKSSTSETDSGPKSVEEIEAAIRSTLTQLKAAVAKLRSL